MSPALSPASCVSLLALRAGSQLHTEQQGDDSVPGQDRVSSPAFRITAAVTGGDAQSWWHLEGALRGHKGGKGIF